MHMGYMVVQKWTTFGKKWKVSTKSRNRRHIRKVVQKWTTLVKNGIYYKSSPFLDYFSKVVQKWTTLVKINNLL